MTWGGAPGPVGLSTHSGAITWRFHAWARCPVPWTGWTWFVTEGSQEDDDFIFFGYVIGPEAEWGYFSLCELEAVRGPGGLCIERDLYFTAKRKTEIPDFK